MHRLRPERASDIRTASLLVMIFLLGSMIPLPLDDIEGAGVQKLIHLTWIGVIVTFCYVLVRLRDAINERNR